MERGKPLLRWAGLLLVGAAAMFFGGEAQGDKGSAPAPQEARPDRLTIDTLAAFGKLELPPVTFFHDKHTEALQKEKKDCQTCHLVENGRLSLLYKRTKAANPAELQTIYHEGCIGCHMEMAAAGKHTGPLDGFCRLCHNARPPAGAALEAGMDKVLHYRHVASKEISSPKDQDNCGVCHHLADPRTKKLVHVKGQESGCRTCHGEGKAGEALNLRQAAHQQCVLCHLELGGKGVKANGPYVCAGCHGAAGQALTAKNNQAALAKLPDQEVPRLNRGQPNATLIAWGAKDAKAAKPILMNPVPFDHQAHEKYTDSCRVCHHATMDACGKCHTLLGAKEGGGVTFEQAMHAPDSKSSCIGCHTARQAAPQCAGCHVQLPRKEVAGPGCSLCHLPLPKGALPVSEALLQSPQQKAAVAEIMLKGRTLNPGTYPAESVPDTVVIQDLADQYGPVTFAHRKHQVLLEKGTQGNKLAQYFHSEPGTLCQGCHHNSPASLKPPRCGSCHAAAFDARQPARPGLQAAYHGQCMVCHREMSVKPVATACTECHQPKKQ
jgi:hypothetical protein